MIANNSKNNVNFAMKLQLYPFGISRKVLIDFQLNPSGGFRVYSAYKNNQSIANYSVINESSVKKILHNVREPNTNTLTKFQLNSSSGFRVRRERRERKKSQKHRHTDTHTDNSPNGF